MKPGDEIGGFTVVEKVDYGRLTVRSPGGDGLTLWEAPGVRSFSELATLQGETPPALTSIAKVFEHGGKHFVATEVLVNKRLSQKKSHPPDEETLVEGGLAILKAIEFLHQHEMVYGHLALDSVVDTPIPKLVNHWIPAPEEASTTSDIVGFGRFLFEWATGQPRQKPGLLELRPKFNKRLAAVVDKASEWPGYDSLGEVRSALETALVSDKGGKEVTVAIVEEAPPPPGIYLSWQALVVCGLAVVGLLWAVGSGRRRPPAPNPTPGQIAVVESTPRATPTEPAPRATRSAPRPEPKVTGKPEPRPTREPSTRPAASRTPKPRTAYPKARSYPKAEKEPEISGSPVAVERGSTRPVLLKREKMGFDLQVPAGWKVTRSRASGDGLVIEAENLSGQETVKEFKIRHEVSDLTPSRWQSSLSLKKSETGWEELGTSHGAQAVYYVKRGNRSELELLFSTRLPYYQYRYLSVVLGAEGLGQQDMMEAAAPILDGLELKSR